MMRSTAGLMLCGILLLSGLGGCCACIKERVDNTPLPPPITAQQQVALLNARSWGLRRLRATTELRGVELRYPDKKGQEHVENVEGTLLLRQHFGEATFVGRPDATADVMLMGMAFAQQVFQAGRNATVWWFIVRGDAKTATVGDATRPIDWEQLGSSGNNAGILRADLVQDLLGLTELRGEFHTSEGDNESHLMRVDDLRGVNDLMVIRESNGRGLSIKRELIVDRRTGDITEVRLYNPRGILVVQSTLSDYRPVAYAGENNDAVKADAPVPRVPYRVLIEYPAQRMSVSLTFEKVTVPAKLNDVSFETPDFAGEGLKVERVE